MSNPADNPVATAQRLARQELPRRFYKDVGIARHDGGFAVTLDGRVARTPGKHPLAVSDSRIAEAVAAEWSAQETTIDPATMPLTRLVNASIDRVTGDVSAVRAEIVGYAGSDLICYRAEGPVGLSAAQEAQWTPLVDWARTVLGVRLKLAAGVVHVPQESTLAEAAGAAVASLDPLRLAALHMVTTLTGSAIIALALLRGRLDPDAAWIAAHVDEDWQISQWGSDEIAMRRRANRRREFDAAALVLAAH